MAVLLVATALLFLLANRGAYYSYFDGDDFDTLSWAVGGNSLTYLKALLSPRLHENNLRPVGAFYYHVLGSVFGLRYGIFVAVVHVIHLANIALLCLVLWRLKFSLPGIVAGVLFFAFHAATLDAYWRVLYVYDVLCGAFCLLTLLLYMRGYWLFGLITFWLAFKSKEVAVMLPLVLAAYEYFLSNRQWKRLLPYFAISTSFGLQALLHNQHDNTDYTLRFTLTALAQCIRFYSSKILLAPYAGLALLLLPFFVRSRQMYFGLACMVALLTPMLFLPGRQFSVYWYAPMIGAAIIIAGMASKEPVFLLTVLLATWLPANYQMLRQWRPAVLDASYQARTYVAAVADFARKSPDVQTIVYIGAPSRLPQYGVEGIIHLFFKSWPKLYFADSLDPKTTDELFRHPPVGAIKWYYDRLLAETTLCWDAACLEVR